MYKVFSFALKRDNDLLFWMSLAYIRSSAEKQVVTLQDPLSFASAYYKKI